MAEDIEMKLDRMTERFDEKLDKVIDTQSKLTEMQHQQSITLVRNTVTLEEHVKRTNILENEHKEARRDFEKERDTIRKEIEPLKRANQRWQGVLKAVGIAASAIGILFGVLQLADAVAHFMTHIGH